MGRNPCCVKEGLNKGAWTKMEDRTLTEYIAIHGEGKWRNLPKRAGLKRCGKSCRLRWLNYLRPDIKRGNITRDEEDLIIRLHKLLGNRWSLIAGRLPGRTDNEIKNFWNTNFGNKKAHDHSSTNSETTNVTTTPRKSPKNQTPPKNTYVVRTKASRCTKVFLPHKSQSDNYATSDDNNSNPTTNQLGATPLDYYDPTINDHRRLLPVDGLFSPFLNMENNDDDVNGNSCGFMGDSRLDEGFLSEFLNVDFSEIYGGEGGKANITSCVENDHHELHGVASRSSMAPIIDSEVDCWLS